MMRSMYSGVSGLRNHQIRMDVISNNIANVNTAGYKSGRVTFQDTFYQLLRGGAAPDSTAGTGGVIPRQVGIGMAINSIDTNFAQGAVLSTGVATDLMLQGDGFFMVSPSDSPSDEDTFYTRAGVFGFDSEGNLVNKSNGMFVLDDQGDLITVTDYDTANTVSINSRGQVVVDGTVAATIGLAKFPCPEGLERMGENLYRQASAAGTAQVGFAGDTDNGLGNTIIVTGALEMSNVDLALEFTEMITTERGYQANARTITTSDEMLQELINLKR